MPLDRDIAAQGRKLRRISNVEVPRANSRALNQSSQRVRTRSVRGLSAETRLKQKAIRKRYRLSRATPRKQAAKVKVYTRDVSAISQFTEKRISNLQLGRGTSRRGVRVAGRTIPSAFFNKGAGGNIHVFRRTSATRYPIEPVKFPIQDRAVAITSRVAKRVMKKEYPALFKRDLNFRISKLANT